MKKLTSNIIIVSITTIMGKSFSPAGDDVSFQSERQKDHLIHRWVPTHHFVMIL